jgi:ribosome-associated protein
VKKKTNLRVNTPEDDAEFALNARPSKTRAKNESTALQKLGADLLLLRVEQLKTLDLPESLFDAILETQNVRSHEGMRRHLQYVGKLMRQVEPEPIRAKMAVWDQGSRENKYLFKQVETWRDKLLLMPAVLSEFCALHPAADAALLQKHIAAALLEKERNEAPKSSRLLFRAIQKILEDEVGKT